MKTNIKRLTCIAVVCCFLLGTGAAALADGEYTAVYAIVANPVSADRLNVRQEPALNATSIAKLYNGTYVRVLSRKGNWAYITVGSAEYGNGTITGYVHTGYLNDNITTVSSDIATPILTVDNRQGTGINMRREPSMEAAVLGLFQNGDKVTVLAVLTDWYFVQVGGRTGYMSKIGFSVDLSVYRGGAGQSAALSVGGATMAKTAAVYSAMNGDRVIKTLARGTAVGIIALYDTGWALINYQGNSEGGFVPTSALSQ